MAIERILDGAFKPFEAELPAKASLKVARGAEEAEDKCRKTDAKPTEVEAIASEVQIYLKRLNTELRFEVDSDSKEVIVKIVDPENDEVIRQIPSEELLAIRKRMKDLVGVLYDAST
ncbi:MAG: flagellar protein FlaG [Deltaproteobacteria bacterium]|nr:flagellar protein FlaG [Deltaproteobacteria bacterium]